MRLNAGRGGLPLLTSMDPLAMLLWHACTRPPERSAPLVTGI